MDIEGGVAAIRGFVIDVYVDGAGSSLTVDVSAGASVLSVQDASDFAEAGGTLVLPDGTKAEYDSADMDADTVTLSAGLADDQTEGSVITPHPPSSILYAIVDPHGAEDNDPVVCRVPHSLWPLLPVGTRNSAKRQESVIAVLIDGDWMLVDVVGIQNARLSSDNAPPERILRYTVAENSPGFVGVRNDQTAGETWQVNITCASAPTADATFDLLFNGASVVTMTIPAGKKRSPLAPVVQAFDASDKWKVEQTDPKDCGADIVLFLYFTLDLTP